MTKKLNVGLIGYGFMGRTHSNAYCKVNHFFDVPYEPQLQVVCGLEDDVAKAFAENWGYKSHTTDWKKVVEDDKIDLVDICVPNNVHAEIAIAAAKAGKAIICEKPLALNGEQAETMVEAVEKAGVVNLVSFNYRRVPAVTLAKMLIDEGRLGHIFHYRANFLQDWTISKEVPQGGMATRRLYVKAAGFIENWICYKSTAFSAKELTVLPSKTVTIKDSACYGFITMQGHGTLGVWEIETPALIRYGQLTYDEFFVSEKAAKEGVTINNPSSDDVTIHNLDVVDIEKQLHSGRTRPHGADGEGVS